MCGRGEGRVFHTKALFARNVQMAELVLVLINKQLIGHLIEFFRLGSPPHYAIKHSSCKTMPGLLLKLNVFLSYFKDWIAETLDPELARKYVSFVPRITRPSQRQDSTSKPTYPTKPVGKAGGGGGEGGDPSRPFIDLRRPQDTPPDPSKGLFPPSETVEIKRKRSKNEQKKRV